MASLPCSHITKPPQPCRSSDRKSIEEAWKDINLASLCNMDVSSSVFGNNNVNQAQPTTLLTLMSSARPIFQKQHTHAHLSNNTFLCSSNKTLFDASETFTKRPPSNGEKKRAHQDIHASSDPRHKRMLRNRESAVRSRARKQAYNNALEMKIARLTEENSRLKKQVEELQFSLSSAKPPKVGALCRTTSSPF